MGQRPSFAAAEDRNKLYNAALTVPEIKQRPSVRGGRGSQQRAGGHHDGPGAAAAVVRGGRGSQRHLHLNTGDPAVQQRPSFAASTTSQVTTRLDIRVPLTELRTGMGARLSSAARSTLDVQVQQVLIGPMEELYLP